MTARAVIGYAWMAVGLVWLITGFTTKRTVRTQAAGSRLIHAGTMILAFLLIFDSDLAVGPLAWRFVPKTPLISYIGVCLTLAGLAFAIWARFFLGKNWSSSVTVKEDHELMQRGPYGLVRHPIYSGLLLGMLGTALAVGQLRGLIALVLATVALRMKSSIEESFMVEQFGSRYDEYRRNVKALVPFVW